MSFIQINFRLREWGLWFVACVTQGLGYPGQSTLVSAKQGSRSTAPLYPKDNAHAEEVHQIIIELQDIHPDWVTVLKQEYTESGCQQDKIRRLGINRTIYRNKLEFAKTWIEAKLN